MSWLTKTFVIVLVSIVSLIALKDWILLPIGIIALYFIIRWIADLFWVGRDKGHW
jgi:hypothetical protein